MSVILVVIATVLVSMGLILIRGMFGPTNYDRMLAANIFGTKTMVVIALLAYLVGEPMFLDIALVYAMINFVTTIAFLKYIKYRSFTRG